jgi:preprotein translocase subunit SecA
MLKLLAKIFGDKSQKDIKLMMPLVEATKKEGELLISLSNDDLRNKTVEIQNHINEKQSMTRLLPCTNKLLMCQIWISMKKNLCLSK